MLQLLNCAVLNSNWVTSFRTIFYNVAMPDWSASSQSGTRLKKMLMPEPFWYRNKETQSGAGMLRYGTEMIYAGLPMPVASALMPMPSYDEMWTKPFMTPVFDCRLYNVWLSSLMLQDSEMQEIGDLPHLRNAIFGTYISYPVPSSLGAF